MPCLGRPFQLGMLYDCRSDRLVPGMTLWDSEVLHKALEQKPQASSNVEVIAEDSIEHKTSCLGINASLKVSLLGGLVNVSGAATYLNDRTTSKRQARVSLRCKSTSKFEQLDMDQLGHIRHPKVFDNNIATHVVTGLLYGAEALLVFDREVEKEENYYTVHGKMEGLIKALPSISEAEVAGNVGIQGSDKKEADRFQCKFYGDFLLQENPSNFQHAVKVYQQLPKLMGGENAPKSVPITAWLYPLSKVDSKAEQIVREISVSLVNQFQELMEQLNQLEIESNDIANGNIYQHFHGLKQQISKFKNEIAGYRANVVKHLTALLPQIQGGSKEEAQLAEVLKQNKASPFSFHHLSSWLKGKDQEQRLLTSYLTKLEESKFQLCFSPGQLDALHMEYDKVVCFAFKVGGAHDDYLEVMSAYLRTGEPPESTIKSKPWYEDATVKQSMRKQLKQIVQFSAANEENEDIKFVITESNISEAGNSDGSGAVILLYNDGIPEVFDPPGQPGKPQASSVYHDRIQVKWTKPDYGGQSIKSYTVFSRSLDDPEGAWKTHKTMAANEQVAVSELVAETIYFFKVRANCEAGFSAESSISDPIQTKISPITRPAVRLIQSKMCALVSKEQHLEIYQLSTTPVMKDEKRKIAKCHIGKPNLRVPTPERVLMVVGATGAGKTTLIDGIVNYILGVTWEDNFRFKLITDEGKKSQAESQTTWITAYTIHHMEDSRVPYTITIIDTPGFGDTKGIQRDRMIASQIKQFFSVGGTNGIDQLHGVGFVAQAALARLSPSQRYIFDSILANYGKDIGENIFLMVTFGDGQKPPVLEAVKAAEIPHKTYYKFNNSALFAKGADDNFDEMFWKMGVKSFDDFFKGFGKVQVRSLTLTKEVLREREQLENAVQGLQPQIQAGLSKIEQLRQQTEVVKRNKALIEQNKDFTYTTTVPKSRRYNTPRGRFITNCLTCHYTCHDNCAYENDDEKRHCCAISGDYCKICPGRCYWRKHVNQPFYYEIYEVEEVRTSQDLKDRYDTATEGKSMAEAMISNMRGELKAVEIQVLNMINTVRKSLKRLDDIALKPNPLTEVEYIDLLIESEKHQAHQPGWMKRVEALREIRKQARIMAEVKHHNPQALQMKHEQSHNETLWNKVSSWWSETFK